MSVQNPYIDIRLNASQICYLSNEHPFEITIFINLCSRHPVTIIKQNSILNAQAILDQGYIEIVDSETGAKVEFPTANPPSSTSQGQPPASDYASSLTTLDTRTTYVALTTASNRKESYYLPIDCTTALAPNRTYTVSWKAPHEISWWVPSSKDAVLAHAAQHNNVLPPTAFPPISYCPINTAHFITRPHLVQPPTITVSLSAPSSTYPASSSSSRPFLFTLQFTSHFSHPVTVLANRPLTIDQNSDIIIFDALTSQEVGLERIFICGVDEWVEEDFIRLIPETPYREERVLDQLEGLEAGKEYVLKFVQSTWRWWGEEEVRSIDRQRLPFVLPVRLVCHDEVRFWAE